MTGAVWRKKDRPARKKRRNPCCEKQPATCASEGSTGEEETAKSGPRIATAVLRRSEPFSRRSQPGSQHCSLRLLKYRVSGVCLWRALVLQTRSFVRQYSPPLLPLTLASLVQTVQVGNLNVSTLWFQSMWMENADGFVGGCLAVDATDMVVAGRIEVQGGAILQGVVAETLEVKGGLVLGGVVKGLNVSKEDVAVGGTTLVGDYTSAGRMKVEGGMELAGQTVGVEGAVFEGGMVLKGKTVVEGELDLRNQTVRMNGGVVNGEWKATGEVTLEVSGHTHVPHTCATHMCVNNGGIGVNKRR